MNIMVINNKIKIYKVSISGNYGKIELPVEWLKNMGYPNYVKITFNNNTLIVQAEAT